MIEPKDILIDLPDGRPAPYVISKFDAVAGREIVSQYPVTGLPKIGEYETNEKIMLKLMGFVAVPIEGAQDLRLVTRVLVNQHVPDWETLAKLEWAMMEYNCSFFAHGKASTFLDDLIAKLPASISSMLTDLLAQSSGKDSQPSES